MAELRAMQAGGRAEDVGEMPAEDLDVASQLAELKRKLR